MLGRHPRHARCIRVVAYRQHQLIKTRQLAVDKYGRRLLRTGNLMQLQLRYSAICWRLPCARRRRGTYFHCCTLGKSSTMLKLRVDFSERSKFSPQRQNAFIVRNDYVDTRFLTLCNSPILPLNREFWLEWGQTATPFIGCNIILNQLTANMKKC